MKTRSETTYGESWYIFKQQLNTMEVKFEDDVKRLPSMPRMTRRNATEYYNQKCSNVFNVLGMVKRVRVVDDFESRLPFVIAKVRKASNVMIRKEARKNNILLMEMVS